jgi:hypothetical protein
MKAKVWRGEPSSVRPTRPSRSRPTSGEGRRVPHKLLETVAETDEACWRSTSAARSSRSTRSRARSAS